MTSDARTSQPDAAARRSLAGQVRIHRERRWAWSVRTGYARRLLAELIAAFTGSAPLSAAAIILFLALPQLYLFPRGTIDIALTTLVTALLLPGLLVGARRGLGVPVVRLGLFRVLLGLLAIRLLALAWSPDPRAGLQPIVLLGQFAVTLLLISAAARQDPDALRKLQRVYWPWVAVEAGLVVLFRLLPGVEHMFLQTVGGFFAGQNTVAALFGEHGNNVVDPAKSGGVFVNANVAAMFLGVNGLAALAVSAVTRTRWVRVVGVAALVAILFTGSKSATILALVLPAAAYGIVRMRRSPRATLRWQVLVPAGSAVAALLALLVAVTGLLHPLLEAFITRTAIWAFGAESFRHHPVLGLGYGGWQAGFARYAASHHLNQNFPPHNVLLAAWATTGIAGLVLTVMFFAFSIKLFVRAPLGGVTFAACGGAAVAWILIQGMGENTDVFGEIHLIPVVALLVGYLTRYLGEETKSSAGSARRRDSQAPTVPAVRAVHHQPGPGVTQVSAVVRRSGPGADQGGSLDG